MLITLYFRNKSNEHEFVMAEGVRFRQQVKVTTQVDQEDTRFGIDQKHIANFVEKLLKLEVDGRRFRTKYQIEMASGAPQAENFLWTILGNKVSVNCKCLK